MALVRMVHAVHVMRHPTRISLDANDLQLRMTLEDAAVDEGADDVLVPADDRKEAVNRRTTTGPNRIAAAGENMEADRHVEVDGRFPEGIVNRVVVIGDLRI